MRNDTLRSLRATRVIAAVLVLGSTPAFAQDASAPTIDARPPAAAPPPPAATVSTPAPSPATNVTTSTVAPTSANASALQVDVPPSSVSTTQQPSPQVVAPIADTAPAPKAAVVKHTPKPAMKAEPKTSAQAEHAAALEQQSTPASPSAEDAAPAMAAIPPASQTLSDKDAFNSGSRVAEPAQPAQDSKPAPIFPGEVGMIAGGLVVLLGIGGGAAFLASRRRRTDAEFYEPVTASEPIDPVRPVRAVLEPERVAVPVAPRQQNIPVATDQPIPSGEEREALIRRMVAAAPDAENPFTSGKARRRRARLILQAREQREAQKPFDFRTYKPAVRAAGSEAARASADITA
jgi:hypothetical protein